MRNRLIASESLLRRFVRFDSSNGLPEAGSIAFPNMSVNRECLSNPVDLLKSDQHKNHGVFQFLVCDIPDNLVHHQAKTTYNFVAVEDEILPDNPAHAEIECYVNNTILNIEPPKLIRTQFRADLFRVISVRLYPK